MAELAQAMHRVLGAMTDAFWTLRPLILVLLILALAVVLAALLARALRYDDREDR